MMMSKSLEVKLAPKQLLSEESSGQDSDLSLSQSENENEKEMEIEEDKKEENAETGRYKCLRYRLLDRCALSIISEASCEDDNDDEIISMQDSVRSGGYERAHPLHGEEVPQQGQEIPADRPMIVDRVDDERVDEVAQNNGALPAIEQPVAENRHM